MTRDELAALADPRQVYGDGSGGDGDEGLPCSVAKSIMGDKKCPVYDEDPLFHIRWWCRALARWKYTMADAMIEEAARAAREGGQG